MNRLLLYVHFNKFGTVSDHVIFQLKEMRPLFSKVIVLSNSIVSQEDRERLQEKNLFDELIQRTNTGFDFAAWQEGFSHVGFDNLAQFDNVTIMNDTTFGPLYDMNEIYDKYDRDETIDFWGITNHQAYEKFPEHIQSYFISFKNKIIISNVFLNFWKKMQASNNVQDIIDSYETQFTKMLVDAGFTYDTVLNTIGMDYLPSQTPDFSYFRPDVILFNKAPFIKVKTIALRQDVAPYVIDYIKRKTEYPTHLIIDHMSRIDIPDYPYLLAEKTLDKHLIYQPNDKTVAVHLHVYYVELLSEFLTKFDSFSFVYDLFITTDNEDKEKEIIQILSIDKLSAKVVVTGNVGRDIFPMLLLKNELASYDIIGHFHTKKSVEADFFAGESWRTELSEMLIDTADASVQSLSDNKNLGIVIADIPTFFRFNKIVDANNEATMVPAMTELWQRMNLSKAIDFNQLHTFTMSYGTFFWAKYDAIKPLFDLKLSAEEMPNEPLPQNSILHAMERLLVYVAWANNYDFIISLNKQITPFIDNKKLNIRLAPQLKEIIKQQQVTPKYLFQIMKKITKKLLNKVKKNSLRGMMSVIKKVIDTYQNEGMRAVARKISDKIRGRSGVVNNVNSINSKIDLSKSPQMPQIEDIVSQSVYKKPEKIAKTKLKITFITPPVGPGGGGHSTIARFANFLQNNGHQVSFAIYNTNTISQTAKEAQDVFKKSYGLSTVVKLASELTNEDVVFATSWETAYGVLNLKTKAHKFYFVQDFEPMFFGVGSRYMLAEATYKFGFYGITAGKWLTKKVAQYGMLADYFDFGVDLDIYKPKPSQVIKKQKKIIFYARAHTERRGFELGVLALQIFKEKYPEYEIAFFGQDTSGYEIPFEYTNLGILTKNELSKLYQESVACLVLSLTNVSLLPLELLASGCVPVMNGGENNTLVLGDINGIEYTTAYPTSLAEKLCSVVERDDIDAHSAAISESVEGKSWQKSYEKVEKIILQEVTLNG